MTHSTEIQRTHQTIVVVPCYNEALRLDTLAYNTFLDSCDDVTLLFVDDGSTDETPHIIERLRQRHPRQICTLRMSANVGKAEAVRRGVQIAMRRQPAFVGYWDSDLATPLEVILTFRGILQRQNPAMLVMGSRVSLLGRNIRRSGLRHFLGRVFATAAAIVLRLPVYDTQCGAKLFRAGPDVASIFAEPFGSRWIFDVEILARIVTGESSEECFLSAHERIYEFPLDRWEDVAASRLRRKDFILAVRDLTAIYFRYMRRGVRPRSGPSTIQLPAPHSQRRDAA